MNKPVGLPVISELHSVTTDELRRRSQHALEIYDSALGERLMLDYGVGIVSPDLRAVPVANQIQSVSMDDQADAAAIFMAAETEFMSRQSILRRLTFSHPNDRIAALLQEKKWVHEQQTIWLLTEPHELKCRADVHIVPGRSSYAGLHQLADAILIHERNQILDTKVREQFMLAAERHLDDPRIDSLLALSEEATPLGVSNIVNVGEIGVVTSFIVHPDQRGRGIGASLMAATLELAARSRYRHVTIVCSRNDPGIERFYGKCGFTRIGVIESWTRPE